jgi:glycosyltransferase involved in cell wall biosynthesis
VEPGEPRWATYSANVQLGLIAADMWVAPTTAFRNSIQSLYAPPTRGRVIHNGSGAAATPVAKEPFILCAGRLWDEAKNVNAVIAVARDLSWPVKLAGAERSRAGVGDSAGVPEALGELPRSELLALMGRAAIYVAPAQYEPFGLAILEAARCGCALVLSDVSTLRELWSDAALFVDPRNQAQLRAVLQRLCTEPILLRRLQQAACRRAQHYSLDAMVQEYCDAYASLMAAEVAEAHAPFTYGRTEAWA